MEAERYTLIKEFMWNRDVSQAYSDPAHHSTYDFSEIKEVWEAEQLLKVPAETLSPEME